MEGKNLTSPTHKPKRLATLVGCNYAGTPHELRGCINDVHAMRDLLVARFGFAPADVAVLTDDVSGAGAVLPTGANIKRALAEMVARAAPGDVLFFHYSGHGTLVPRWRHGAEEEEEEDEAIVPCDFNLVTDEDFRAVVDRVPRDASLTVLSDSCHSGGLIDNEKEQIGPDVGVLATAGAATIRARFIPYPALVDHLSGASGVDASHHVGDHLVALFGADASAKFRHRDHHHDHSAPAPRHKQKPDEGILLSGCQRDETSADVPAEEGEGWKACGAFSSAVQAVLAAHPAPMSNRDVVRAARALLREQGFEQHPCLYCSDGNADKPLLRQQADAQAQEEEEDQEAAVLAEL